MPADRSKISPVVSILCIITDSLRATATAARLKPTFSETGALLDRITHHVNILEMNGDSYRLAQSRARKAG
ncbi:hypothetical protein ASD85_26115 [Rhizobium sp. Root651]|jgi:hypothetical protein|nr:hypothetical protein ASD85_26115 [Rhizobium sp. Root651]